MTDEQFAEVIRALKESRPAVEPVQLNGRVLGIAATVLTMVGAWMGASIGNMAEELNGLRTEIAVMQREVAVTQGNRFTVADALEMRREIESGPPNAGALSLINALDVRIQRLEQIVSPGGAP